jgi:hypothetical protein
VFHLFSPLPPCSFKTNLPLQYPVAKLAAACLFHSARLNKVELGKDLLLPDNKSFHDVYGISQAEIDGTHTFVFVSILSITLPV